VTEAEKRQLARAYGYYNGRRLLAYELDHLISVELGGAPNGTGNLWPEADYPHVSAHTYYRNPKDRLEDALNRRVCSREMPLAQARDLIRSDWVAAYREYVR
jgi:hypothetical protein